MSPLLTRLSQLIFPAQDIRTGIVFDSDRMQAIQVSGSKPDIQIDWLRSTEVSEYLFTDKPVDALKSSIADFFAEVAKCKDKATALSIALPDPVLSVRMLDFENIPKSSNELLRLVKWRLSNELNVAQESMHCAYQLLAEVGGKQQLMAIMLNNSWFECLKESAQSAGVTISNLTLSSMYPFNYWYERCAGKGEPAGFVVLTDYYWTLFIWDKSGCTRLVRSKWLSNGAKQHIDEIASDVALQIEQTILAFSMSSDDNMISHLYITGEPYQVDGLSASINARIDTDCISLKIDTADLFASNKASEILSSTLATVLYP